TIKQCPNTNFIIYTRLDELPDTYLRCPQCNEPLVEIAPATNLLSSTYLADEATSPYVPLTRSRYAQLPLPHEDPYIEGDGYEDPLAEPQDEALLARPPLVSRSVA